MRTTLTLDDELLAQAQQISGLTERANRTRPRSPSARVSISVHQMNASELSSVQSPQNAVTIAVEQGPNSFKAESKRFLARKVAENESLTLEIELLKADMSKAQAARLETSP